MSVVNYYRIHCTTDNKFVYTWAETEPTTCPENPPDHTIDADDTTIVKTLGGSSFRTEGDNRLVVAPSLMPDTFTVQFIGNGDDVANGTRGNGQQYHISMPDGGPTTMTSTLQCVDSTLAIGGTITSANGNMADTINISMIAPATPVTVNGSGTGNCNLFNVGPGNIIIPAPLNNGTHDVDLTTPLNANVAGPDPVLITQATPIPAEDISGNLVIYNGWWNWEGTTGAISSDILQQGQFNLFDFPITLTKWIRNWPVWTLPGTMYQHKFFIGNKGARVLPHWKLEIVTTRDASHAPSDPDVHYQLTFYLARRFTV